MKRKFLILSLFIIAFLSSGLNVAKAQLLLEENFNYVEGTYLTDNGWVAHSAGGTTPNPITVTSPSLEYDSYAAAIGYAASVSNNGEDVNKSFSSSVTSGDVYASLLIQTASPNSIGYFLHFGQSTIGTTFFTKVWVNAAGDAVGLGTNLAPTNWFSITPGQPSLIVIKYNIESKTSSLFVINGAIPTAEPTPSATLAETATINNVGTIALRQYNGNQRIIVDAIRVAKTWAELFPVADTFAPEITISPANNAVDVPIDAAIKISFNEPVRNIDNTEITDPASLITFKLNDNAGADVNFTAAINSGKDTITITPSATLLNEQKYYIELAPVEDTLDNATSVFTSTFTTIAAGDVTPPVVVNAWAESLSSIKVAFSEPLDNASATDVANYTGIDGISTAALNANEDTVTLSLSTELVAGVKDTIAIQNVKDKALNVMAGVQKFEILYVIEKELISSWHFDALEAAPNTQLVIPADSGIQKNVATIYADGTNGSSLFVTDTLVGKEITSFVGNVLNDGRVTPSASMALCPVNKTANGKGIVIKFNMAEYKDAEITFATRGTSAGFKTHYYEYSIDGVNFTPFDTIPATTVSTWALETVNLAEITDINNETDVYIRIIFDGATSATGNNRLDNVTIKATSGTFVDVTPPVVDTAYAVDNSTIKVVFNEKVDKTTAETVANYSNEFNISTAVLDASSKIVTVTLSSPLTDNVASAFCIENVKDISGNTMSAQQCFNVIHTVGDVTPPIAVNAWAESLSSIKVAFSEPLDNTSATDVANYTGIDGISTATLNTNEDTVTLSLSTELVAGVKDTIAIQNVKDKALNVMAGVQKFEILYVVEKTLISSWHFDDLLAAPNTLLAIPADSGIQKNVATIYADGTNGSSLFVTDTLVGKEITSFVGNVLNDGRVTPSASMALCPVNKTANGKGIVIKFNMAEYKDAEITFATRGTAAGFKTHYYEYSIDGVNFTPFDTIPATTTSTWALETINLAEITDINNEADVYIRIKFDGATSTTGNNRLDNITIKATSGIYVDTEAPVVDTAYAVDYSTIKVVFNEKVDQTTAENIANYTNEFGISTAVLEANSKIVTVTLSSPLTDNVVSTFCIDNVKDLHNNTMSAQQCFNVIYTILDIVPPTALNAWAESPSSIKVAFSEPLDNTSATDVANYTGIDGISTATLNANEDTVTLSLSTELVAGVKDTIIIQNIADKALNVMAEMQKFEIIYVIEKTLISSWHFDNLLAAPNTLLAIPADSGIQKNVATIYADGTNGSSLFVNSESSPEITAFNGSTLNDGRITPNASKALSVANKAANGKGIVIKFDMAEYKDAEITFATRGTAAGFTTHNYEYSKNGVDFIPFETIPAATGEAWVLETVDLTQIAGINNASNVYIRVKFDGATSTTGNNRLDNITIKAYKGIYVDEVPPVAINASLTSLSIANVSFDEDVDPATAENVANYTGLGNIASAVMNGTDKVILTLVNPLVNAQIYTLTVGGISDLAGNTMTTTYQFELMLDTTSGINNHSIDLIEIYPNPANNYFIIDNIEDASMINVYNSIGKAIISKDCRELNRVEIDATILESGLYYVSIYYNDGQVVSKPISIVK